MERTATERYARPLPCPVDLPGAWPLAGTALGFREVAVLTRGAPPEYLPAEAAMAVYPEIAGAIGLAAGPRADLPGLAFGRPTVMGVVNVTPDSFSDGGLFDTPVSAVEHALALADAGASVLDIGGESTRPGAEPVPPEAEAARVLPVIEGLLAAGCTVPVSIDTRNAATAEAARLAGAQIFNDVSALTHDPASGAVAARYAADGGAVCLMHARGDPRSMQRQAQYEDVLLDVYDALEDRLSAAMAAGVPRAQVLLDPGIGFAKDLEQNLALIRGLSLFHGLGAPILLGVSRKRFIGTIGGAERPADRMPGSIAAGLGGLAQGAHLLRVHDVVETVQAIRIWQALGEAPSIPLSPDPDEAARKTPL
ncbi:MAG: dihydropteroate synthase [Pseudomonadota bacterium]